VTRADGVIERRSQKVILRRGAPAPPPAPRRRRSLRLPRPGGPGRGETRGGNPRGTPGGAARPAPAAEVEAAEVPAAGATVRVVEKPVAPRSRRGSQGKGKEVEEGQAHEKKVQKGVLKQTIIKEVLEEPEAEAGRRKPPLPLRRGRTRRRPQFQPTRAPKRRGKPVKEKKAPSTLPPKASKRLVKIEEVITVGRPRPPDGRQGGGRHQEADRDGMPTTLNQLLDADTASLLAQEYGFEVENVAPEWRA